MIIVNNVQLKAIRFYTDHEGMDVPYGNIYFKNKKVGTFRTDAWGGLMDIYFINNTVKTDVYNAVKIGLNLLGLRKPQNNETDMIPLISDEVEDFVNLSLGLIEWQKVIKREEKKNIKYLFGALIPYTYRKTAKCNRFYYEQETDAWTIILNNKTQSIINQIKAENKNKYSLYLFLDSTGSISRI